MNKSQLLALVLNSGGDPVTINNLVATLNGVPDTRNIIRELVAVANGKATDKSLLREIIATANGTAYDPTSLPGIDYLIDPGLGEGVGYEQTSGEITVHYDVSGNGNANLTTNNALYRPDVDTLNNYKVTNFVSGTPAYIGTYSAPHVLGTSQDLVWSCGIVTTNAYSGAQTIFAHCKESATTGSRFSMIFNNTEAYFDCGSAGGLRITASEDIKNRTIAYWCAANKTAGTQKMWFNHVEVASSSSYNRSVFPVATEFRWGGFTYHGEQKLHVAACGHGQIPTPDQFYDWLQYYVLTRGIALS